MEYALALGSLKPTWAYTVNLTYKRKKIKGVITKVCKVCKAIRTV